MKKFKHQPKLNARLDGTTDFSVRQLWARCPRSFGRITALALALILGMLPVGASDLVHAPPGLRPSLQYESEAAVDRGLKYLRNRQLPNGSWANHPVITAMAVLAVEGEHDKLDTSADPAALRGTDFLVHHQRDDGAISNAASMQYPVYSTAVAVLAVARLQIPENEPALFKARNFLIASQHARDSNSPDFGGFPGIRGGYADLMTTQWVLEALYITDHLACRDATELEIIYKRALTFIRNCQNPTTENGSDRGVFLDSPRQLGTLDSAVSPATPTNRFLRTAAGIKSLIYGRATAGDPQLENALESMYANLQDVATFMDTVEASPYTSFFFLGRALRAVERSGMAPANDSVEGWRNRVAVELLNRQSGDGSWRPGEQAWWENHPDLVTAYAVLTLQGFLR
jgi:squalene-hopene/tetraprenyl-beta-curcumene cyclase